MEQGLPFEPKDLNKLNADLLIGLFVQHQALFDVLIEHLGLSYPDYLKKMVEKEQDLLSRLYAQYGSTPDLSDPGKTD